MEAFQIARTQDNILITIDASRINADALMQTLRRIQVEYLAQLENLDNSIFTKKANPVGYEPGGEPITEEELVRSILEGSQEAKAGEKIPFHQLKAEFGLQ
ncbi:MAG: hypothetical protein AAB316_20190 [Bacteroidota bacterium]